MQNNQEAPLQDQVNGTRQKSLSGLEKFSLISGVVGLVADVIALSMFIAGFWNLGTSERSSSSYVLFVVITGLVLVYGWIVVAWTLARRALNHIPENRKRRQSLEGAAGSSTAGVGLFLVPLAIVWLVAAFSGGLTSAQSPEPAVFQTATPVTFEDHPTATSTPNLTVTPTQASGTTGSVFIEVIFSMLLLYPLSGMGVWICLMFLMPLVYGDLSEEKAIDDPAAFDRLMDDVEDDWSKWEERIGIEMERYRWIEVSELQDMADLFGVSVDDLEFVFAKYASLHPRDVKYGYLYNADGLLVSENKVLVKAHCDLGELYLK